MSTDSSEVNQSDPVSIVNRIEEEEGHGDESGSNDDQILEKNILEKSKMTSDPTGQVDRILSVIDRQLDSGNASFLKLPLAHITPHMMHEIVQLRLLPQNGFKVHYLDLTGNLLGDTGASVVARYLSTPGCTVQYLNLSMNQIGPEGCKVLCDALSRKGLRQQQEKNNQEQEAATVELDASETLQHLDLSMNQIGFGGIAALCDMLQSNSTLVSLNVRSNMLRGEKCVKKLLELSAIAQNRINFKDLLV